MTSKSTNDMKARLQDRNVIDVDVDESPTKKFKSTEEDKKKRELYEHHKSKTITQLSAILKQNKQTGMCKSTTL